MKLRAITIGFLVTLAFFPGILSQKAGAQENVWLQIEAQPNLKKAEDRARAYASAFANVRGFKTRTGWYAIALGPFSADEALDKLEELKAENLIPRDSFIADGTAYGAEMVAVAGAALAEPAVELGETRVLAPADVQSPEVAEPQEATSLIVEETLREAKASEKALTKDERTALQSALAWFGHYNGKFDGAFGRGTRTSMADWQEANGMEPTGVLTTLQRASLIEAQRREQSEYGFETLNEPEAGIEISMPKALVDFEGYAPPFVRFIEKGASGVQIMLISEPGDQTTLAGLFDALQSLEAISPEGTRALSETGFEIEGHGAQLQSYAMAELSRGMVKGYVVIWEGKAAAQMDRVLPRLRASFRAVGDKALDPGLVPLDEALRAGLMAGMQVKTPKYAHSGFFVDAAGSVLTSLAAVNDCKRITIDRVTDADIVTSDRALGVAILKPKTALSPSTYAKFSVALPAVGAQIAVSGYSYGERLPAPVVTFGTFEEAAGLKGELTLNRLTLDSLPGDEGGPMLDKSGATFGLLLPAPASDTQLLPKGVAFSVPATALMSTLSVAGVVPVAATPSADLSPYALQDQALGMTALISCWD